MNNTDTIRHILVIEDESGHAELIMRAFEVSGGRYDVKVTSTINEAQQLIRRQSPDIALVDYRLPDGQGDEIIALGKDKFPVIMLTSHGDEQLAVQAIKLGALDYVAKSPESFDTLPHVVDRSLREWQLMQDGKEAELVVAKMRQAIDTSGEAIFLTDTSGIFTYINPGFSALFGYSTDDLVGSETLQILTGDAVTAEEYGQFWISISSGKEMKGEILNKQKDGSLIVVEGSVSPIIDKDKNIVGFLGIYRDVSERKQAENKLRQLSQAVEQSPVSIIITDTHGAIEYVNPKCEEVTGYTLKEIAGKNPRLLKSGHTSPEEYKILWENITQGKEWQGEFQNKKKNGELYWESARVSPIVNAQGETTHFIAVKEEITRRKQTEEALRASDKKFMELFMLIPIPLAVSNKNGAIVYLNKRFTNVFGYTINDLPTMKQWWQLAYPDETNRHLSLEKWMAAERTSLKDGKDIEPVEFRVTCKNGTERIVMIGGKYFEDNILATFIDVTERKKMEVSLRDSELKFRTVADYTYDWEYWKDENEHIVYMSPSCERITGYSREEFIADPSLIEKIIYREDASVMLQHFIKVHTIEHREHASQAEFRITNKNGSVVNIHHICRPIYDEHHHYLGRRVSNRDVTERMRVEMELIASEEKFKSLSILKKAILESPEGIIVFALDVNYCYVDFTLLHKHTMKEIWGNDIEIGSNMLGYILNSTDREKARKNFDKALAGEKFVILEEYGSEEFKRSYYENRYGPIFDETKNIIGVSVFVIDITERKRAENAQRESEKRYRELIETMPDGVYKSSHEGKFLEVNPAMVKILGYSSMEELLAIDIKNELYFEETDRDSIALKEKHEEMAVFRMKKKDGSEVWVEDHGRHVCDNYGTVLFHEGVMRDINERKLAEDALRASEETFRRLFKESADPILLLGDSGFLDCNQSTIAILGYRTKDEFLKKQPWALSPERQPDGMLSADKAVSMMELAVRNGYHRFEWIHIKSDGTSFPVEVMLTPIILKGERIFYTVWRDIAERKKAEEALRQAQKLESIGTLAGGIAHDFNNLLNAILGQSSIALNKIPKENPAAGNITKAIKATERAADLTRQLLAYSGKGKFFIVEIDLNLLVKENVQILEVSIPKTTQLKYELDSSSPRISGDIGQIQQVMMNLIINAGEAMGTDLGTISVRTGRIDLTEHDTQYWKYTNNPLRPGAYALLQVKDNGHGMRPEVISRIFDPFFTTKFTGRGLGLAAVLGIIRGHFGGMRIESEEEKGTLFEVVFPLVDHSTERVLPQHNEAPLVDGKGKTILVIDDDPFVFELLDDILSEAQFTVTGARDPVQGIEIFRRDHAKIAMVILDYSMPGMDGKKAFEELLKINRDVKVLLCSGYTEAETLSVFETERPAGFFQKPYDSQQLLEKVSLII